MDSIGSCASCFKKTGSSDYLLQCNRCSGIQHHKCAGLNDSNFNSYQKLKNFIPFYCSVCTKKIATLDDRVAALEAKVDDLTTTQPAIIDEDLISNIVSRVLDKILPKMIECTQIAATEAVELKEKRMNLVMIGLPENNNDQDTISQVCDQLNVDPSGVVGVFRDGQRRGDWPRILKVRFGNADTRRRLLTGLRDVRANVPTAGRAWFRPDLTYRQRQEDKKLREELEARRGTGERCRISRGKIVSVGSNI